MSEYSPEPSEAEIEASYKAAEIEAVQWFREQWKATEDQKAKRRFEIAVLAITDWWDDHNEYIPDWDFSCMCDLCRSYA